MGGYVFWGFFYSVKKKSYFGLLKILNQVKLEIIIKKIIIKYFLLFLRPSDRANIGLK